MKILIKRLAEAAFYVVGFVFIVGMYAANKYTPDADLVTKVSNAVSLIICGLEGHAIDSESYEFRIYEASKNYVREEAETNPLYQAVNIRVVDKVFQQEYVAYEGEIQCDLGNGSLSYSKYYIDVPVKSRIESYTYMLPLTVYQYTPSEDSDVPAHSRIFGPLDWTPEDTQDVQDAMQEEIDSIDWGTYADDENYW